MVKVAKYCNVSAVRHFSALLREMETDCAHESSKDGFFAKIVLQESATDTTIGVELNDMMGDVRRGEMLLWMLGLG